MDFDEDFMEPFMLTMARVTKPKPVKPPTSTDRDNDNLFRAIMGKPEYDEELCNNPMCNHSKDCSDDQTQRYQPESISSIDDLIELGKSYHCKNNNVYCGINLRILNNLVLPLTQLKNMVGMENVKENIINQIIFFLQGFNKKEGCNECIDCVYGLPCANNMNNDMLHTVITGPPGVGKTELGKILGRIYKAMGVLSKGHMKIVQRSDLVGKYLGHTAAKTQDVIDACSGGVMFIDEAYSLGNNTGRDSFSKECIDTLNQNLTERRDFLCIIAGYADSLDTCFFSVNEGLKRRFTFRYDIDGYTPEQLMEIFVQKVKRSSWIINTPVEELVNFFRANMQFFPHYGGDVETFFLNCKIYHGRRVMFLGPEHKKIITMDDIVGAFNVFLSNRKYKEEQDKHQTPFGMYT